MQNIEAKGIYTDLMRKFRDKGHEVYIVYPRERKLGLPTEVMYQQGIHLLGVKTLNVTKTNVLEKGIGQILLESQFKMALKQHFSEVWFDVILYSTPPITFTKVIKYTKKKKSEGGELSLVKGYFPSECSRFRNVE